MADFVQNGGTNGGRYASNFTGILRCWEESYNINSNTSLVKYQLILKSGSSGRFTGLKANYSIKINEQTAYSSNGTFSSQNYNSEQIIHEGNMTVSHNSDGSKSISCSAIIDFESNSNSPRRF